MGIMFIRKPKPARKGKELEALVQGHLEKIAALKGYVWIRPDSKFRRKLGLYTDKQPCDFVLFAGNKGTWLIECKECSELIWSPEQNASEYQRESIGKSQKLGLHAGFLVWFRQYGTIEQAYRWFTVTKGKLTAQHGECWNWQKFYE